MPQETLKSFAVIDTNVIVAAARKNKNSSSYDREIMQLVMDSNITLLVDKRVLEEYLDVLSRPTHRLSGEDIEIMMESIIRKSIYVLDVEKAKIEIWDHDDIPFFEITESTLELDSRLVTHNTKDFVEKKYDEAGRVIERKPGDKPASDRIVTPEGYITSLSNLQRYLDTFNISISGVNESFDEKMQSMLGSGKYVLARDIVFYDSNSQSLVPTNQGLVDGIWIDDSTNSINAKSNTQEAPPVVPPGEESALDIMEASKEDVELLDETNGTFGGYDNEWSLGYSENQKPSTINAGNDGDVDGGIDPR